MEKFIEFIVKDGLLLIGLFYGITFLIAFFRASKTSSSFGKKVVNMKFSHGVSYAAFAGAVTPFCSCSTIPVLSGMLRAQITLGVCFSFLLASPLVNEAVIIVMASYFGFKYVIVFVLLTLTASIAAGYLTRFIGVEKYVQPNLLRQGEEVPGRVILEEGKRPIIPMKAKFKIAVVLSNAEFKSVLPYLVIGVLIGGAIYGYMPTEFIKTITEEVPTGFLIIIMALLGIPFYFNMVAAIPIAFALSSVGIGLGPITAFLVSGAGASLPELILLLRIFKLPLVGYYLALVVTIACIMGFVFTGIESANIF